MNASSALLFAVLALTGPGPRSTPAPLNNTNSPNATIAHALVSVIEDVEVPAQEAGLLVAVHPAEGTLVKQDQLVAQLDDRQAKLQRYAAELERDAALAKASEDIEVRYAQAAYEVADADLKTSEAINAKTVGLVPATEMRKLRLTKKRNELEIDRSKLTLDVAKKTAEVHQAAVKVAEHSIERRKLVAPLDGEVIARLKEPGEWVNVGEPVLRVIRMDRLRVEGLLAAADFDPSELFDQPVLVEVELAHGRKAQFQGRVTYVSPLVTAGNKYRVRAEVINRAEKNQWLLRPGMTAVVAVGMQ